MLTSCCTVLVNTNHTKMLCVCQTIFGRRWWFLLWNFEGEKNSDSELHLIVTYTYIFDSKITRVDWSFYIADKKHLKLF